MLKLPTALHQKIVTFLPPIDGRSVRLSNQLLSLARVPFQYYLDIYLRRKGIDPVRFMLMMQRWQMRLSGSTVLQVITGVVYDNSDFDLYLQSTNGSIFNEALSEVIMNYLHGSDVTEVDIVPLTQIILSMRTTDKTDDEYMASANHTRVMIAAQCVRGKFNFIFIINDFQSVFNNYDFDFVKNSYDGTTLRVFDWNSINTRHTHLTWRRRFDNYTSFIGTVQRIIRYTARGFTFSYDEKFASQVALFSG